MSIKIKCKHTNLSSL